MKENDIRPEHLKSAQQECIDYDIDFLLRHSNAYWDSPCPACKAREEIFLFEKAGFRYVECGSCQMLYMNPRPTEEILAAFYAGSRNYKYFNDFIFPASREARRNKIFIPRIERLISLCNRFSVERGKILEVGAAHGIFCEELVKNRVFKEVVGIEASYALFASAASQGFRVYNGILEDLDITEQFNVVASFEVIEHITNPGRHLAKIQRLLYPGGLLVLTFPNYGGFEISTNGVNSDSIDHEHVNYFTRHSISILLESCGFEVLEISTPGELDVEMVRRKILNGELTPSAFLRSLCIDDFEFSGADFQVFLKDHLLSSHMWVAAVNRGDYPK